MRGTGKGSVEDPERLWRFDSVEVERTLICTIPRGYVVIAYIIHADLLLASGNANVPARDNVMNGIRKM